MSRHPLFLPPFFNGGLWISIFAFIDVFFLIDGVLMGEGLNRQLPRYPQQDQHANITIVAPSSQSQTSQ